MKKIFLGLLLTTMNQVVIAENETKLQCGMKGTIEERIKDCGNEQHEGFVLLARTPSEMTSDMDNCPIGSRTVCFIQNNIYLEISTGLIWSDRLLTKMNSYDANEACRTLFAKGGISNYSENWTKIWRLPTLAEYKSADKNGIRKVLPNMKHMFWTATGGGGFSEGKHLFNGISGEIDTHDTHFNRNRVDSVRCVTR